MQKWLVPLVASCFSLQSVVAADDMSLEGIVILGQQKSAVVLNNGKQITVKAGDALGEWTVDAIEARQVFLRSAKGERKELKLKTNLAAGTSSPENKPADGMAGMQQGMNATPPPVNNPFAAAAASAAAAKGTTSAPAAGQPAGQGFQPKIIEDKDIPAGHRRVKTPFGDVLVKDPPPPAGQ